MRVLGGSGVRFTGVGKAGECRGVFGVQNECEHEFFKDALGGVF